MMTRRFLISSLLFFAISFVSFAQKTGEDLINQSLALFCKEEVVLECIRRNKRKKDTICFYSLAFKPTDVVHASKNVYYRVSNEIDENYNTIIRVRKTFNAHGILMLNFKVLKSRNKSCVDKVGLVRCQIVNDSKISFVDARFD